MSNWSKNNRACTTLWTSLHSMEQLKNNFAESGDLNIRELTFYNALSTTEFRKQQAMMIAEELDNIFRNGRGASYEAACSRTQAISAMLEVLSDENKLLSELALAVDECYAFWGEVKPDNTAVQ